MVVHGVCHSAATALIRGITTALYLREKTGQGQLVETSMLKTVTTYDHISWIHGQMISKDPVNYPPDTRVGIGRPNPTGYLPARTKDGHWIQLGNIVHRLFRSMVHSLEMDFIYDDPRYRTAPSVAVEHVASLENMMLEKIQEKTLDEWMELFAGKGSDVAAEPYMTSETALEHPQIVHNGHVANAQHSAVGELRQLGPMVIMSETPGSAKGAAPEPGQHTDEVLARLDSATKTPANKGHEPMPKLALEGVTAAGLGHSD